MKNKFLILIFLLFCTLFLVQLVSADIWVSPKEPTINGNNYVFVTYNDSTLNNTPVLINITNPNSELKQECDIVLNEYGFGRCKYNLTSSDSSGTWGYATNTSVSGTFEVGKISMNVRDRNSLTSIKYGQKTTLEINLSYENLMPKEISRRSFSYDAGSSANPNYYMDVDNDGDKDIVMVAYTGRVNIWDNLTRLKEGLMLVAGIDYRTADIGTFYYGSGCVLDDFDGDGVKSIICGDYSNARLLAWANVDLADGTNIAADFTGNDEGDTIRSMPVSCDVNNDSIADQVAVGIYVGDIIVYNYSDIGGFTTILDTGDTGFTGGQTKMICSDIDNDGYNEWLLHDYVLGYYFYDVNLSNISQLTMIDQAPDRGNYYAGGASVDFDNDGKIETVVPLTSGRLQLLEFNKSGTDEVEEDLAWSDDTDYGDYTYGSGTIEISDLNKNGRPDFIVTGGIDHPNIIFTEYDPIGDWYQETLGRIIESSYTKPAYVDFDGDGIKEVMAFGRYSGNTYIYKFNGDAWDLIYKGWLSGSEDYFSGDAVIGNPGVSGWLYTQECAIGDMDEDGKEEVICAPYDGNYFMYEEEDLYEKNITPNIELSVSLNDGTHESLIDKYSEIRLLNTGETLCIKQNIALGVTDLLDDNNQNQGNINPRWTDGIISTDEWRTTQIAADYATLDASSVEEASWSRIKLPQSYQVGKVSFYNYFSDGRSYMNVIARTTNDSTGDSCDWSINTTIFDNSDDGTNSRYGETSTGKQVYFSPHDIACLRESTSGFTGLTTTSSTQNLRTEIEIYETDSPCEFDVNLNRQSGSSLSVKQNWTINVTASDRTGNLINLSQTLSIPVTYSSLPFSVSIVGGTEYYPGQEGQIVVQLKDEFNDPVTGATCLVDYYYPNLTLWLDDQATSELAGVGIYYDSFTLLSVDGVYIAVANCTSGSFSDIDSHTFHVSGILIEMNNTLGNISQIVTYINQTITNTIIPYLSEINSTTHTSYNYLTGTIQPLVNEANSTIHSVLDKWGTYNASQLYNISNVTYVQAGNIYTDTQILITKWGTYTAGQLYNISNATYVRTGEIYSDMATASALSTMQTDIDWLQGNVATQTNMTETFSRLLIINNTINTISSNLLNINSSLQTKVDNIQGNVSWLYGNVATASALSTMQTDVDWLQGNVATQTNMTETFSRLLIINNTINTISSNLLNINSSLQTKVDNIQTDVNWLESNVATNTNITLILSRLTELNSTTKEIDSYLDGEITTRLTELNSTTKEIDSYLDGEITTRLTELNTTTQNTYDYLQNTVYTKINNTFNDTQYILTLIGTSSDAEGASTLFGEHAYTQNRLTEIQGNLTELNTITSQINTTLYQVNSTVSTILTEVDDLEEMHQCSLSPNSTICTLLNNIKTDTENIYSSVSSLSLGSGSLFEITSLVSGSPKYANENALIEATFAGSNGSAITPDTINLTIYDPNNNIWTSAVKTDFTQGSDNVWKYTKSIGSSPTTGMYTAHLQGSYLNVSNSRIVQFRIATGGPYKVYLDCPASLIVGNELQCTVILQDEGESATESTSTVWVDTDNDGVADAGESQVSFSKQTVALQNVTQSVSINVPSSHATGLYVVRIDTSYANSAQPNSGASDSVTLTSDSSGSTGAGGTGGSSGGGGITGKVIYNLEDNEIEQGKIQELKDGEKIKFNIIQEGFVYGHSLEIIDLQLDRATIIIYSQPITILLYLREEKKLDLDGDGFYDLYVRLEKIENNKADFYLKSIYEEFGEEPKLVPEKESEEELPSEKPELINIRINKTHLLIGVGSLLFILLLIFVLVRVLKNRNRSGKVKHLESKLQKQNLPLSLSGILHKQVITDSGDYIGEIKDFILRKNKIDCLKIKLDKKQKFGVKGIIIQYNNVRSIGQIVIINKEILDKIPPLKN